MTSRATTIRRAWQMANPQEPIPNTNDSRYVDLRQARGGHDVVDTLLRRVEWARKHEFTRQLLVGHPGSGKTTELHSLAQRLRSADIFTVFVEIEQMLSLDDVTYADVLLVVAERILEQATDELGLQLDQEHIEALRAALLTGTEVTRRDKKSEVDLKADLKLFTRQLKLSSSKRREFRHKVEEDQIAFLGSLNRLLDSSQSELTKNGKMDMVVVIDGLEKMRYRTFPEGSDTHEDFFVRRAEILSSVKCHQVITAPVAVTYEHNLQQLYTACDRLPMVAIKDREGRDRTEGLEGLRNVLESRMVLEDVFEDPEDVSELLSTSGGHVRDLLRLVRYACEIAGESAKITKDSVVRACDRLIREYDMLISSEDIDPLVNLHETRMLKSDAPYITLLRKLLALEYNNKVRWGAVHPAAERGTVLQNALIERKKLM